jgi:shikimate kinase
MDKSNIILTGFMGTGKTTVGKLIARKLNYAFIDTDEVIQKRAGKTIPKIFTEDGEEAFRKMEAVVACELADQQKRVICTGGRLMLDKNNADALGKTGRIFCLDAAPQEIFERVSKDTGVKRPLLSVPDPKKRIIQLMQERKEGYAQFLQIGTSQKTPEEVAQKIITIFTADTELD